MIKLDAIVNGQTFSLSDGLNFGWLDYDAFGLPPIQNIAEQGPLQHGMTWLDFRLGPRIVPFTLDIPSEDVPTLMGARAQLLDIFPPGLPVTLKLSWDGDNVRQLQCYVNGGLNYGSALMQGLNMIAPVELIAPDPCWFDPTQVVYSFSMGGGGGTWAIPWAIPWAIGASNIDQLQTINYFGNWLTYPVITIIGPITNPVIWNNVTGEKLDFTGQSVGAGHYFTIDCRYGYKTIIDDLGAQKFATNDSNLSTFHLERRLAGNAFRANSIRVTGTGANAATLVNFAFYTRYTGA